MIERHQKVAELLLERGADPNVQDDNNNTPLHLALQSGLVERAELLARRRILSCRPGLRTRLRRVGFTLHQRVCLCLYALSSYLCPLPFLSYLPYSILLPEERCPHRARLCPRVFFLLSSVSVLLFLLLCLKLAPQLSGESPEPSGVELAVYGCTTARVEIHS
jgi:ankyrin repeat protein